MLDHDRVVVGLIFTSDDAPADYVRSIVPAGHAAVVVTDLDCYGLLPWATGSRARS